MQWFKRNRYIFNEETFEYERQVIHIDELTRKFVFCFAVSVVLAVGFLALNYTIMDNLELIFQKRYQAQKQNEIKKISQKLAALENQVNTIHKTDGSFFRSILELEVEPQSMWEGGTGGSDRYRQYDNVLLKKATAIKDKLTIKIKKQKASFEVIAKKVEEKVDELKHVPSVRPVAGRITSRFRWRKDPINGRHQFHYGLDFNGYRGQPIKATADGVVITASNKGDGYGNQVEINHGIGYTTKYAHMSRIGVKYGERVKRNQIIGYIGNTGHSRGDHLHYEIIKKGEKVNPQDYFYID